MGLSFEPKKRTEALLVDRNECFSMRVAVYPGKFLPICPLFLFKVLLTLAQLHGQLRKRDAKVHYRAIVETES